MENEDDYLADKAELEWQKQEVRDKKSEEFEQYLESYQVMTLMNY